MPVFDFSDAPDKKNPAECTYTTFQSSEPEASPEKPILILDNSRKSGNTIPVECLQSGQTYDL